MCNQKLIPNLMIVAGLAAASPTVLAENNYYFGGNLARAEIEIDASELGDVSVEDASSTVIYGRLGYQINDYFSAEIRAGVGINDDNVAVRIGNATGEIDLGVDKFYGAYLRAGMPASESLYPYLVAGYTRAKIEVGVNSANFSSDWENDFSYGVGLDIAITDTISGNIEYMNYYDDYGIEVTALAIGLVKSF